MSKIIMTSKELVERLKNLAGRETFYKNRYPYNLCYNHPDGRTSADCVNLYKALLNGYDVNNRTVGYYQNNLSNTGDCTEWGLMSQCSDVSKDFKKLKAGEPRLLYKEGHIGGYIGEEVSKSGKVYNVIECTAAWGGGILYSYVDKNGIRYNFKGGAPNGAWTHHGLMTPWVKYVADTVYNGVDYAAVYDYEFYKGKYADLRKVYGDNPERYLAHFVNHGMKEGRQAKESFNVWVYKYLYPDLRNAYGEDITKYYLHYIKFGEKEKRAASISFFAHVYNSDFYKTKYKDLSVYGGDENLLIKHFTTYGMNEGRQANEIFIVNCYKANYKDLREAFKDDLQKYYLHYVQFGFNEGRIANRTL